MVRSQVGGGVSAQLHLLPLPHLHPLFAGLGRNLTTCPPDFPHVLVPAPNFRAGLIFCRIPALRPSRRPVLRHGTAGWRHVCPWRTYGLTCCSASRLFSPFLLPIIVATRATFAGWTAAQDVPSLAKRCRLAMAAHGRWHEAKANLVLGFFPRGAMSVVVVVCLVALSHDDHFSSAVACVLWYADVAIFQVSCLLLPLPLLYIPFPIAIIPTS